MLTVPRWCGALSRCPGSLGFAPGLHVLWRAELLRSKLVSWCRQRERERGALCFNNPGLRRRFAARGVRARACHAVSEEGREASEEGSCRQGRCALRVHSNQGGHVVCPRGPELPGAYSRG